MNIITIFYGILLNLCISLPFPCNCSIISDECRAPGLEGKQDKQVCRDIQEFKNGFLMNNMRVISGTAGNGVRILAQKYAEIGDAIYFEYPLADLVAAYKKFGSIAYKSRIETEKKIAKAKGKRACFYINTLEAVPTKFDDGIIHGAGNVIEFFSIGIIKLNTRATGETQTLEENKAALVMLLKEIEHEKDNPDIFFLLGSHKLENVDESILSKFTCPKVKVDAPDATTRKEIMTNTFLLKDKIANAKHTLDESKENTPLSDQEKFKDKITAIEKQEKEIEKLLNLLEEIENGEKEDACILELFNHDQKKLDEAYKCYVEFDLNIDGFWGLYHRLWYMRRLSPTKNLNDKNKFALLGLLIQKIDCLCIQYVSLQRECLKSLSTTKNKSDNPTLFYYRALKKYYFLKTISCLKQVVLLISPHVFTYGAKIATAYSGAIVLPWTLSFVTKRETVNSVRASDGDIELNRRGEEMITEEINKQS